MDLVWLIVVGLIAGRRRTIRQYFCRDDRRIGVIVQIVLLRIIKKA